MKYCAHGYLTPQDLTSLLSKDVAEVGGLPSPYCVDCWKQPRIAELLAARFYLEPTIADPCSYGFCDLISQIVRQRAWARDSFARDAKESDLRFRLLEKKSVIEAAIGVPLLNEVKVESVNELLANFDRSSPRTGE